MCEVGKPYDTFKTITLPTQTKTFVSFGFLE